MFTRLLTSSPQFLLFLALVAGGVGTSCGKVSGEVSGEANTETASDATSAPVRKIAVGNRTYDTKEIRTPTAVIPSSNDSGAVGTGPSVGVGVVFDPSDIKIEPKATPPPPWAPSDVYEVMKTACIECHYAFRFKESVVENRHRLLLAIKATGGAKPMPPSSQTPNYTTFRNTSRGQLLIAFLESAGPTPTAAPTSSATAAPTASATAAPSSMYSYADVQPIIQASCVAGCHSSAPGSQVTYISFEGKANVISHRNEMWVELGNNSMPRSPRTISAGDRAKLLDWLLNGGGG